MIYKFEIPLSILPKPRPRVFKSGGKSIAITPPDYKKHCDTIKYYMRKCMAGQMIFPKDSFVRIENCIIKTKNTLGDIDNFLKTIFDCGNRIIWYDDKSIINISNVLLQRKQLFGKISFTAESINDTYFNELQKT